MPNDVVILGIGGNCIDILEALEAMNRAAGETLHRCIGFLDDNSAAWNTDVSGVPVLGGLDLASSLDQAMFVNGIGSPKSYLQKPALIAARQLERDRWLTVIHPTASVSRSARLGVGVVLLQQVTVASNAVIGDHVMVLPNSVISHDDVIGDHTIIAGGVCVSGGVRVEQNCYLGSNSSIIGNVTIGERSLIGIGSVVLCDVPPDTVMVGNPARRLRDAG